MVDEPVSTGGFSEETRCGLAEVLAGELAAAWALALAAGADSRLLAEILRLRLREIREIRGIRESGENGENREIRADWRPDKADDA